MFMRVDCREGGLKMAKLLNCRDMDLECDYICAETEEELLNRAVQYAGLDQSWTGFPSNFQKRVRLALAHYRSLLVIDFAGRTGQTIDVQADVSFGSILLP